MKIENLIQGTFLERPNRFTVIFEEKNGKKQCKAHLKDPGRLKELLYPGVSLLLKKAPPSTTRKTKFDVIAVLKNKLWVLINSGFHSDLATEIIESEIIDDFKEFKIEKREYTFGKSRLDFLLRNSEKNRNMLLEVKGCTLVKDKLAQFPDAPTTRGKRHLDELITGKTYGFESTVLFLILKEDAEFFSPNYNTDPSFSKTLHKAQKKGVNIIPFVFKIYLKGNSIFIEPFKKIKLKFK